jgi:transposase
MTRHTDRHHVTRLEVIDTGRRRRWTTEEKFRIVEESLAGRHRGCTVARRYEIASSQLYSWRKAYREGRLGHPGEVAVSFMEARVVTDQAGPFACAAPPDGDCGAGWKSWSVPGDASSWARTSIRRPWRG